MCIRLGLWIAYFMIEVVMQEIVLVDLLCYFRRKPKTQRGKRFLQNRESKLEENTKRVMLIRGGKTSDQVTQALKDIASQFVYFD